MPLTTLNPLPIDTYIRSIVSAIENGQTQIIVKASPGSGKTTRIPPALLPVFKGQIFVLEPRRLAAKMSAVRVADELKASTDLPENICGWQMRHDSNVSKNTRLLFLTEGMFPIKVLESPSLSQASCIILDEFHERHTETDVALAMALKIQQTVRPDLVIIVMSATLDLDALKAKMPAASVIEAHIPIFPVAIEWWRGDYQRSLIDKAVDSIIQVVQEAKDQGNILVFLPGAYEIRRCYELLENRFSQTSGIEIYELRGTLDKTDQERVFQPSKSRKIILSTNIAESSLTIPGITTVIDSGLARSPSFDPINQVTVLETKSVCQASVIQRTGRAGRTAPGHAIRLFTESDYAGRPEVEKAEILRTDLTSVLLSLKSLRQSTGQDWTHLNLPWIDAPTDIQWQAALQLLQNLEFLDENFEITPAGEKKLPLHPRLSKFIFECSTLGLDLEGCWLTAILESQNTAVETPKGSESLGCDLLARYDMVVKDIHNPKFRNIKNTATQLQRLLGLSSRPLKPSHDIDIEKPLITAFFDRIAFSPNPAKGQRVRTYNLATGGETDLYDNSAALHFDWIVAWASESTKVSGSIQSTLKQNSAAQGRAKVSGASGVNINSIKRFGLPKLLQERKELLWDDKLLSVKSVLKQTYGSLTLSETRTSCSLDETKSFFKELLLDKWPAPFENDSDLTAFVERVELLHQEGLIDHVWNPHELKEMLILHLCDFGSSFAELKSRTMSEWLCDIIGQSEWDLVEKLAPSKIKIGAGFMTPVHYDKGKPPWLEARLQNFFGQLKTPQVLNGKVPLTLHLLAPNQVALQITTDLESFWTKTYPQLRNEYMRKYPRHYWPENPKEAEPPVRGSLKPKK